MTIPIVQVMALSLILDIVAFQQHTTVANAVPCEIYGKYIERVICLLAGHSSIAG